MAYANVTIETTLGSGAPGCETTPEGCYIPTTATVDVGGVVIMANTDTAAHTFTSGIPDNGPSGIFDTGLLMAANNFEWSPDTVGEVPYFCMVHPWMIGTIVVGDGGPIINPPNPDPWNPPPTNDNDNQLEIENQKLRDEIRDLKTENKILKNQINSLKDQIVAMSGEFVEMISQLNEWFREQLK